MADYSQISSHVKIIDPLAVITAGAVGGTSSPTDSYLSPPTVDGRWIISVSNIEIIVV